MPTAAALQRACGQQRQLPKQLQLAALQTPLLMQREAHQKRAGTLLQREAEVLTWTTWLQPQQHRVVLSQ